MRNMLNIFLTVLLLGLAPLEAQQRDNPAEVQQRDNEALAITALEALMGAKPERALPLVERVLQSDHSDRVKQRALFIASQIDLPGAQQLLMDFARTESSLQGDAIRMIGIGGDSDSLNALGELYTDASPEIRERILQAYLIADRPDAVVVIAEQAGSDEEFDRAVRILAAMGASEQLRQIGRQRPGSRGLMHAYAVAGDLESLRAVAQGEAGDITPEARRYAIRGVAIVGTDAARETLMQIYRGSDDPKIRQATTQALMVAGHDTGLLRLYRDADDPDEKRDLLRMLVMMDSDAALEAIDAALSGEQR